MICSMFASMIRSAPQTALDTLFKDVTAVWAKAGLTDDEASELYAAIQQRRPKRRERPSLLAPPYVFPLPAGPFSMHRHLPCSPDRLASIFRRRRCASSGAMPPHLAKEFRESARALMGVLVQEVHKHGHCARSIAELAARAGICHTSAKQALRTAERLELIEIKRRPRPGQKNLTNIVTIRSPEWQLWIERKSRSTGGKDVPPTNRNLSRREARSAPERSAEPKPVRIDPSIRVPDRFDPGSVRRRLT